MTTDPTPAQAVERVPLATEAEIESALRYEDSEYQKAFQEGYLRAMRVARRRVTAAKGGGAAGVRSAAHTVRGCATRSRRSIVLQVRRGHAGASNGSALVLQARPAARRGEYVNITVRARRRAWRDTLRKYQGNLCCWCKEPMQSAHPERWDFETLEHIHPKSAGGRNKISNLALAHAKCNNERGSQMVYPIHIGRMHPRRVKP
jgi:5-methylcytosine-specific restriction endonuclease McrA